MQDFIIAVVTKIPQNKTTGNLTYAHHLYVDKEDEPVTSALRYFGPRNVKNLKFQAFTLGEILILNDSKKEMFGLKRNTRDFSVEITEVYSIEEAVQLSRNLEFFDTEHSKTQIYKIF